MEITTSRLLLRDYAGGDLPALLAYVADPRSHAFYGPDAGRPDQVRALLATFVAWAAEVPRRNYQLAVALRAAPDTVIGSAGLRRAGLPAGEAELGLELAPAHWRRGYAAEAAGALLAHGVGALGLVAVRGETVSANARVAALVRRLGFEPVGDAQRDADDERAVPAWLRARGWRPVTWRLIRDRWTAGATP